MTSRNSRQKTNNRTIGAINRVSNINPYNRRRVRPSRRRRSNRSAANRFGTRRQLFSRTRTNLNTKRTKFNQRGRHRRHMCNNRSRLSSRLTLSNRSLTLLLTSLHRVISRSRRSRQRRNRRRRRHKPQQRLSPNRRPVRYQKTPTRRRHRISSRTTGHQHTTLSRVQLQTVLASMLSMIRFIRRLGRRQDTRGHRSRQRRGTSSR